MTRSSLNRTAIIINDCRHVSLLRFTEAKLFFEENNNATNFVDDCIIVDTNDPLPVDGNYVILTAGDYLNKEFRDRYMYTEGIIDSRISEDVIRYNKDIDIRFNKRIDSLVENLLKVCVRATKLVYLENTEEVNIRQISNKHFYGLASGWKSMQLVMANNFETVTLFDVNNEQLLFAQQMHSLSELPDNIEMPKYYYGTYNPSEDVREKWNHWHNTQVKFIHLDLFTIPKFPNDSFVWISNVFNYESNIFNYGWNACKKSYELLLSTNNNSIITTK